MTSEVDSLCYAACNTSKTICIFINKKWNKEKIWCTLSYHKTVSHFLIFPKLRECWNPGFEDEMSSWSPRQVPESFRPLPASTKPNIRCSSHCGQSSNSISLLCSRTNRWYVAWSSQQVLQQQLPWLLQSYPMSHSPRYACQLQDICWQKSPTPMTSSTE